MAIEHVNRRGESYFLHVGKTKTGKPKYYFSKKWEGTLLGVIPDGFEVYENPGAQVFLRKIVPRLVTAGEVASVERGIREHSNVAHYLLDVQGRRIVVYVAESLSLFEERTLSIFGVTRADAISRFGKDLERFLQCTAMMRFTLVDEKTRYFSVERWCFRGAIDNWIHLIGSGGDLNEMVAQYCPHLGKESFYELM